MNNLKLAYLVQSDTGDIYVSRDVKLFILASKYPLPIDNEKSYMVPKDRVVSLSRFLKDKNFKYIKKYANRKMYCDKKYVTLIDIKDMILANEDIIVIDRTATTDITTEILSSILYMSKRIISNKNDLVREIQSLWGRK